MNNGAFGENFPYSNFHDLNMDWIIKIAKDFLDQYTHIQEVIANGEQSLQDLTISGLEQLQDKADTLEGLLQTWYNTHSEDIANQLTTALADLAQAEADAIATFNTQATQKATETIATIPDDYTTFFNSAVKSHSAYVTSSNYSTVLSNANNALANVVYLLLGNGINTTNLPIHNFTDGGYLITFKSDALSIQILYYHSNYYVRTAYNTTWNNWNTYNLDNAMIVNDGYITNNNYSTTLPDADNAIPNKIYMLLGNNIGTLHLPKSDYSTASLLMTFKSDVLTEQILLSKHDYYVRIGYNGTWQNWINYSSLVTANFYVTANNYSTTLPDANNADLNMIYMILGNNIPTANLPITDFNENGILLTLKADVLTEQIVIHGHELYMRSGYAGSWNAWKNFSSRRIIRVGDNQEFTTLTSALEYAYKHGNCDVYVNSGTYNLFTELGGASFFDNYVFADTLTGGGPVVGNNCRYFFSPGAWCVFNYTGSNSDVKKYFSPLNAGEGSFEIHGMLLRALNCRYAMHDETGRTGINNRNTIYHLYKNCFFYLNNENNSDWHSTYVIGGGLLAHGGEIVSIEECQFDYPVNNKVLVSYHNGIGGSNLPSASKVSITNSVFSHEGTCRIASYGDNTINTVMFVTGCKLGSAPVNELETPSSTVNTDLHAWNNDIG